MIDKRLMYYRGGAAQDSGNAENQAASAAAAGSSGTNSGNNNDGDSDFDPFGHSRFDVGSGYYGEPVTSSSSNLGGEVTTFAPTVTKPSIWDNIKTFAANTATLALFSSTGINLTPAQAAIANTALGFTNDIGITKSGSISELGTNTLSSIGNLFSENKNTGINTNSFSGNTNSFSGNTNNGLSDNNQNNGGEGGNNDVLSSEYILLLQKMQLGNFTQEDQTRFNLLKTMLGK